MSWILKRWKIQGIPPLNISQYVAERIKKQKNKISIVKKWKKVWKTQGHQFLYLMVCLTHIYMADIKNLLVLLNAQEGKHPCSKRLPFLRKWEAEGKRFLHQLYMYVFTYKVLPRFHIFRAFSLVFEMAKGHSQSVPYSDC